MEPTGKFHIMAALLSEEKPPVSIGWWLDGPHSRSGRNDAE